MRLVDALAALPTETFLSLCKRRGVAFDAQKRISPVEQATRQLAFPSELRRFESLSLEVRRAVQLLAREPRGASRNELGSALLPLIEAGLAFSLPRDPTRFAMPTVFRLQCPRAASDDPRSVRLLLPNLDDESLAALVSHVLGRTQAVARELTLGDLLDKLESPRHIEQALHGLPPKERALLHAIEARGSEVDRDELMELAAEPRRYVEPSGAMHAPSRRSPAFPLLRAGLLFPYTRDLLAIPTEVAAVLGVDRRDRAKKLRAQVGARVASYDLTPTRARFAEDPSVLAVALLMTMRRLGVALLPDVAAPRTAIRKAARLLNVDESNAEFLVALGRADGVYASTTSIGNVGARLFRAWRRFGAWDEARAEPDVLRVKPAFWSVPTPTALLASACIDLLVDVPAKSFASLEDVAAATLSDLRAGSASSRLSRARRRDRELFEASTDAVLGKLLNASMPRLGILDRGESDVGAVVRLSERARRWLVESADETSTSPSKQAGFERSGVLLLPTSVSVSHAVALGDFVDAVPSGDGLALTISEESVEHGLAEGISIDTMRARLARVVASVDARVEELFTNASRSRIACEIVAASAFIRVPDAALRTRFLSDDTGAQLVHVESPEGGLLVRAGISMARVERVLRRLGADLVQAPKT